VPASRPVARLAVALALLALAGCARRRGQAGGAAAPPAAPGPSSTPAPERCGRCAGGAVLTVRRASLVPGRRGTARLRLEAVLPAASFAEANPLVDDVRLAVRDDAGEVLCTTVGHEYWAHQRGVYRFEDRVLPPGGRRAVGVHDAVMAPEPDGTLVLRARGDRFTLARPPRGRQTAVVWIGERCATGVLAPRP
jgi:hypothetical protein